jgi:hypothetical protein
MSNPHITKEKGLEYLREAIKSGQTVYTVLRHVSASGMSRRISCMIAYLATDGTPEVRCIDHLVTAVTGFKLSRSKDGITVGGAGMDMGFHLVESLGYALWPDGTPEPHGTRNGEPDHSGGYALKHRWL